MNKRIFSYINNESLMLIGGLVVIALLLVPYATNGFWFDDSLNSQVYAFLNRVHGGLFDFSFRVMLHWLHVEGRLMLGFLYGYPAFYVFHHLSSLRLAHCILMGINIACYGYLLWMLGTSTRFLTIWAIVLVGLFQIHGRGLDPVAGFAFHYPMLGIQLSIVLILFVKWQLIGNIKYLYGSLLCWLIFMLSYEVNVIFVPIAFALMLSQGDSYRKRPGILLFLAACVYLALAFYLRNQANGGSYAGSSFGLPSKVFLAYLKQLSASFPLASYIAATHHNVPFWTLLKETLSSVLAWVVFFLSMAITLSFNSLKTSIPAIKNEALILSLGMFLLPAIFPAISLRYQNEVGWGIGTLPVYYQNFGMAFIVAWGFSRASSSGKYRYVIPAMLSLYLALNVTLNKDMAHGLDKIWREPRDVFVTQTQAGLFSNVQDGDVIHLRNLNNYITANLIFEWSGKRVYVPSDDHSWFPESPSSSASDYQLSRDIAGKYLLSETLPEATSPPIEITKSNASYRFLSPQPNIVNGMESFPSTLPLIEIQIGLSEPVSLNSVYVAAPNALGEWTTQPANNLWGVGIIEYGEHKILNSGARKVKLNTPIGRNLTLWIPDNGNLSKCPQLHVELILVDGKHISATPNCKLPSR